MKFATFAVGPKAKHERPWVRLFHKGMFHKGVLAVALGLVSTSGLATEGQPGEFLAPAAPVSLMASVENPTSPPGPLNALLGGWGSFGSMNGLPGLMGSGVPLTWSEQFHPTERTTEGLTSEEKMPQKVLVKSIRLASEREPSEADLSEPGSVEHGSVRPPVGKSSSEKENPSSEKAPSSAVQSGSLASRPQPSLSNVQSLVDFTTQSYANLSIQSQAPKVVLPLTKTTQSQLELVNGLPRLAQQWLDANVKPEYVNNLLNVWVWSQSPVVCANQACEEIALRLNTMSQQLAEIKSNDQALAFLSQNNISDFNEQLLLRGETLDINHMAITEQGKVVKYPRGWVKSNPRAYLVDQWQKLSIYTNAVQNAHLAQQSHQHAQLLAQGQHDQALAKAYRVLEEVVSETGLSSVKVPLPMSNQPVLVAQLAQDLRQANRDLQHITGWSGSVLGLNGRVDLVPMRPDDMASTSMSLLGGSIVVRSDWETFAHEWFHALDVALMLDHVGMDRSRLEYNIMLEGSKAVYTPEQLASPLVGQTLSAYVANAPLASSASPEVVNIWKNLHPLLRQVSSDSQPKGKSWMLNLEEKIHQYQTGDRYSTFRRDEAEYRAKHSEKLAYAFGAFATLQSSVFRELSVLTDGLRAPTLEEARHYDTVFKPSLSQIGQSWWKSQKPVLAYYAIPNSTRVAFDATQTTIPSTPVRHMVADRASSSPKVVFPQVYRPDTSSFVDHPFSDDREHHVDDASPNRPASDDSVLALPDAPTAKEVSPSSVLKARQPPASIPSPLTDGFSSRRR